MGSALRVYVVLSGKKYLRRLSCVGLESIRRVERKKNICVVFRVDILRRRGPKFIVMFIPFESRK